VSAVILYGEKDEERMLEEKAKQLLHGGFRKMGRIRGGFGGPERGGRMEHRANRLPTIAAPDLGEKGQKKKQMLFEPENNSTGKAGGGKKGQPEVIQSWVKTQRRRGIIWKIVATTGRGIM